MISWHNAPNCTDTYGYRYVPDIVRMTRVYARHWHNVYKVEDIMIPNKDANNLCYLISY